jgi:uncharacterized coiled-coil protein SlyX
MPDLIDMSLAGPRALRATADFLGRLPEVEGAVARAGGDVLRLLEEVRGRVAPIEDELTGLRRSAVALEQRLAQIERRFSALEESAATLDRTAAELTAVAARLEGSVEHLLDKVPGLSSAGAVKRGAAVVAAVTSAAGEGTA